jgi:hypothetical protein
MNFPAFGIAPCIFDVWHFENLQKLPDTFVQLFPVEFRHLLPSDLQALGGLPGICFWGELRAGPSPPASLR